jgi:hypothetical protein
MREYRKEEKRKKEREKEKKGDREKFRQKHPTDKTVWWHSSRLDRYTPHTHTHITQSKPIQSHFRVDFELTSHQLRGAPFGPTTAGPHRPTDIASLWAVGATQTKTDR